MARVKKLSKIKIRKRWRINPGTRVKKSTKRYSRTKSKEQLKKVLEEEVKK